MVPDLRHVVDEIRHGFEWDFTTDAGLCAYSRTVILALNAHDPDFGHLVKREAQPHCLDPLGRLAAVDVALYARTGQVVDFIKSGGKRPRLLEDGTPNPEYPGNDVAWTVGPEGEYPTASWFAPVNGRIPDAGDDEPPAGDSNPLALLEGKVDTLEELQRLQVEWNQEIAERQIGPINKQAAEHAGRIALLEGQVKELLARPTAPAAPPRRPSWWPF